MSELLNGKKGKHCETNNNDMIFVKNIMNDIRG